MQNHHLHSLTVLRFTILTVSLETYTFQDMWLAVVLFELNGLDFHCELVLMDDLWSSEAERDIQFSSDITLSFGASMRLQLLQQNDNGSFRCEALLEQPQLRVRFRLSQRRSVQLKIALNHRENVFETIGVSSLDVEMSPNLHNQGLREMIISKMNSTQKFLHKITQQLEIARHIALCIQSQKMTLLDGVVQFCKRTKDDGTLDKLVPEEFESSRPSNPRDNVYSGD
ncbi:hypothetical protein Tco_0374465 [Tanacetum coccineum]